jgi:hypothetical protein
MAAPTPVTDLVERFDRDRKVFLSPDYKGEQLPNAKTPHEQESLKRTIAATDRQMDELVYGLYGLTEDEIRIVEGGSK